MVVSSKKNHNTKFLKLDFYAEYINMHEKKTHQTVTNNIGQMEMRLFHALF